VTSVTRTCLTLAAVAALGVFHGALAAPPAGSQWVGAIESGPTQLPVRLTIQDGQNASLVVGAPASCDVPLVFASEQNGTTVYSMRQNRNGGMFCDMQINGRAQLTPTSDGGFNLEMFAGQRNARYQGKLAPALR
jgi:hypothetical protein